MAATELGIGCWSSGLALADGEAVGAADGISGGVIESFMILPWLAVAGSSGDQIERGVKNGFVEIALKSVGPQKFHGQMGRADERTENPRELAAEQQIPGEPPEQRAARRRLTAAQLAEQLQ